MRTHPVAKIVVTLSQKTLQLDKRWLNGVIFRISGEDVLKKGKESDIPFYHRLLSPSKALCDKHAAKNGCHREVCVENEASSGHLSVYVAFLI